MGGRSPEKSGSALCGVVLLEFFSRRLSLVSVPIFIAEKLRTWHPDSLQRRNQNLRTWSIINFNKEGKWLVLLENQIGGELPWALIKQSEAKDIIFLEK